MELFGRKSFWKRIASDRRIIWAVFAFQFIGAGLGLLIAPHFDMLFNMWMGGALGGPLGFVAGLCWELTRKDCARRLPVAETWMVGLIVFAVGAFACLFVIPFSKAEMRAIAELKSIDGTRIENIVVYKELGRQKLVEIADRQALMDFADRCKDIEGYSPNHPVYTSSWHVMLNGAAAQEFEFYYEANLPQALVGEFDLRNTSPLDTHGHFSSKRLREWFAKHVPNAG